MKSSGCDRLFVLLLVWMIQLKFVMVVVNARSSNYQWYADLNQMTGRASSTEKSTIFLDKTKKKKKKMVNQHHVRTLFEQYPNYLNELFFFLHVIRDKNKNDLRLGPITLLTFGKPRRRRSNWNIIQKYRNPLTRKSMTVVQIPIQGGWLSAKKTITTTQNKKNLGFLQFSCTECSKSFQMETNIVNYLPTLARIGSSSLPIHPIGKYIYLKTQSYLHAFVMWRFHKYCHHSLLS